MIGEVATFALIRLSHSHTDLVCFELIFFLISTNRIGDCIDHLLYLCPGNISFSLSSNQELLSWKDASETCGGHLPLSCPGDSLPNVLNSDLTTGNVPERKLSYWLGIRMDGDCQTETLKRRLLNIAEMEKIKCPYVSVRKSGSIDITIDNCSVMNQAICVKTGKIFPSVFMFVKGF